MATPSHSIRRAQGCCSEEEVGNDDNDARAATSNDGRAKEMEPPRCLSMRVAMLALGDRNAEQARVVKGTQAEARGEEKVEARMAAR